MSTGHDKVHTESVTTIHHEKYSSTQQIEMEKSSVTEPYHVG